MAIAASAPRPARLDGTTRAGWLFVGFSVGGFFDGIVLHQILQWHHLLSGLDGPAGSDLPFQIMADGLFHLVMYLVALAGAVLLVMARASGARGGSTSEILRLVLIGFGSWHVTDAVLSHWLLGLHRIRMDSDTPLAWDIGWLVVFGIAPLVLAAILPHRGGPSRGAAAAAASVALTAGLIAAAGPRFSGQQETIVVFRPGMSEPAMMQAVLAAGSRLKWTGAGGTVWGVETVSWSGLATLHRRGALLVSSTPVLAGCLAWTRSG
ncbi:DUF2243 domain-containing protein [Aquibium microcysteis]|uniref:DUF2243 domain-containing protein n=1 Tax=Aquibium microcysteis TaxID=675281 RepID=UPI00165D29CC|nr:DUF2243 domain-containing protein [Aquibium microcysteis]